MCYNISGDIMKDIKLKIISVILFASTLLSTTSCSLKKSNNFVKIKGGISLNLNDEKYSNINDQHVKELIIELIEKVEESNYDLSLDKLIDRLSKTTFIKNSEDDFLLGTYNDEENKFTYLPGDDETIRHELIHMMLESFNNACLDEGLVQIFLHELYGYEIDENEFDASLCKIFCRILSTEELKKFINGDKEVLKNKLASIKPAYEDADQFLIWANNATHYDRYYDESIYNGTDEEFRKSKEYTWLIENRKVVKERIKIYLYNYYMDMNFEQEPFDRLVEIFEVLNLVNCFMYDEDLGEAREHDYFLEDIVNQICSIYGIDREILSLADDKARECLKFRYLDRLKDDNQKKY